MFLIVYYNEIKTAFENLIKNKYQSRKNEKKKRRGKLIDKNENKN